MKIREPEKQSVPPRGSGWVRSLFYRLILDYVPTRYREVVVSAPKFGSGYAAL